MKGKELQLLIKNSGIKIADLASLSGIPEPTIYSLYKKKEIEDHYIKKMQKAGVELQKTINKSGVPVYNADFTAGDLTQFSDEPNRIIGHIDLNGFRKCIAFVTVKGSSMYPEFTAGDLIGIEPIMDFSIIEFGQPFAIETKNGQRMIKIIRKGKDENNLILRSINKEYDDINVHRDKISKLYKVHGPVRDQWQ